MSNKISEDYLEDRLRVEFMDDARDRLQRMYDALDRLAARKAPDAEVIATLRMDIHNLKGTGAPFGYPAVSLVAHRMEDYLSGLQRLDEGQVGSVQAFLDRVAHLIDRAVQPDISETNQILRALPTRYVFDIKDVEVRNVEIMVVTPSKVVAKKVGTELAACGFRSVTVQDPIESISLALLAPPDMLIAAMMMDGLSGLDLICGLHAMSVTRKVPMALLTSLDLDNHALREVPAGVSVIRLGPKFSEDIARAITKFNLG